MTWLNSQCYSITACPPEIYGLEQWSDGATQQNSLDMHDFVADVLRQPAH